MTSSREDYPNLKALSRCDTAGGRQMRKALDEIDQLRDECETLRLTVRANDPGEPSW